jgi:hypothetical protein
VESAAIIREEISAIRKTFDPRGTSVASRHIVIVGYSMGGVIARILSTNIGSRLWDAVAKVPFDQAPLDREDRAELRKLLFWSPVPGLDRTIFIATPHRGTRLADSTFGGIGQRLVHLPRDVIQFQLQTIRLKSLRIQSKGGDDRSQTRKIAPNFFPRIRLAPMIVVPRKHIAHTPSALAI